MQGKSVDHGGRCSVQNKSRSETISDISFMPFLEQYRGLRTIISPEIIRGTTSISNRSGF